MARCALIIGITDYHSFQSLPHVAIDVSSITMQLKQHGFDVISLPTKNELEQQEINFNKKLNSIDIAKELKEFIQQRAYQNEAFVFFSGYILQTINPITDETEAYMVASDTTPEGKNSISFRDIDTLIRKSELRSLVMLLDCCSTSLLDGQYNLLQSTQAAIQFKPNYCLIAFCHKPIKPEKKNGVFATAVLNSLSIDQMVNGEITSISLFNSISQELKIKGQKIIQINAEKAIPIVSQAIQQLNNIEFDENQSPYCGLKPFERQHERFFFGCKQLIEQIFKKLNQSRFVVVIGASGSGKSSVIQAGLIPLFEKTAWRILPLIKPGNSPLTRLLVVFEPFLQNSHSSLQINELIHNVSNGLYELASCLPESDHYVLVIDQFEEVFTLSSTNEQQRFIELLVQLIEQPHPCLSVILVMRVDFLEQCLRGCLRSRKAPETILCQ